MTKHSIGAMLLAGSLLLSLEGCKKKVAATPPPAPPPPAAPAPAPEAPVRPSVVTFEAEPTSIQSGQAATLRWEVSNATNVTIDNGIGTVAARGTSQVRPTSTTTYTLRATGPGDTSATATATVTLTSAPSATPPPPTESKGTLSQRLQNDVQDILFDYDKSDVRADAQAIMARNAEALKAILRDFPNETIVVEGHADERGSAEYNLALGDRRSTSARDYLTQLGVPGDHLKTISYGKERPLCTERTEECMTRNRRAHFAAAQ